MSEDVSQEAVEWGIWYPNEDEPWAGGPESEWSTRRWVEHWNEVAGDEPHARLVRRTVTTTAWEDA